MGRPAAPAAEIPVVDLSGYERAAATRMRIGRQWDEAFSAVGFCSLTGHGLAPALLESMDEGALEFFSLPHAQKLLCRDPSGRDQGYFALATEAVGRSMGSARPPDLCETIQFLNRQSGGQAMTIWPESVHALWKDAQAYAYEAAALSRRLLRVSARALDLPEAHFVPSYTNMTTKIRFVLYPDQVQEPLPGQLRNAPQTDFNGFTILRQDHAPGGLHVEVGEGSTRRRSIVFFTGPSPDAEIICLPSCVPSGETARYAPIVAAAHLKEKVRLTVESSSTALPE